MNEEIHKNSSHQEESEETAAQVPAVHNPEHLAGIDSVKNQEDSLLVQDGSLDRIQTVFQATMSGLEAMRQSARTDLEALGQRSAYASDTAETDEKLKKMKDIIRQQQDLLKKSQIPDSQNGTLPEENSLYSVSLPEEADKRNGSGSQLEIPSPEELHLIQTDTSDRKPAGDTEDRKKAGQSDLFAAVASILEKGQQDLDLLRRQEEEAKN